MLFYCICVVLFLFYNKACLNCVIKAAFCTSCRHVMLPFKAWRLTSMKTDHRHESNTPESAGHAFYMYRSALRERVVWTLKCWHHSETIWRPARGETRPELMLTCATLLTYFSFSRYHSYDGDAAENNMEAAMDKSKPWSRSIEDLHGGSTLPSPITGNGISRVGRHSTLRYDKHTSPTQRHHLAKRLTVDLVFFDLYVAFNS